MTTSPAPSFYSWPVIGPLARLLGTQEFILTIIALIVDYILWLRPELEEARVPMMAVATTLFGLIITGRLAARMDGFTARGFWMSVFRPFRLLLQSRKFWTAVGTLIANVVIAVIPELEEVQVELMALFTSIGLGLMGTIAWEDNNRKDVTPPAAAEMPIPNTSGLNQEDIQKIVEAIFPALLARYTLVPK